MKLTKGQEKLLHIFEDGMERDIWLISEQDKTRVESLTNSGFLTVTQTRTRRGWTMRVINDAGREYLAALDDDGNAKEGEG